MVLKTMKGLMRKELTGDGRTDIGKSVRREIGLERPTKTDIKKRKKSEENFVRMLQGH